AVAVGEGEHAIDLLDGPAHAMAPDQLIQNLRVGAVTQLNAVAQQFVRQRAISVDLAIEGEDVAGLAIGSWLRPTRQVDDGKPGVAEGDPAVDEDAAPVRPAV